MINLALYEPEIPPNTGNIIRLAANTGCMLHLVEPLGFNMEDKSLRRAGLDYREYADVQIHASYDELITALKPENVYLLTTKGGRAHSSVDFSANDLVVFGPETRGLPDHVLTSVPPDRLIRIPMVEGSRSLNLSNAAAVVIYEAWRQLDYAGSR
jgi:tRNA (cytidine/uridine-2'-O-)-methyltransferase